MNRLITILVILSCNLASIRGESECCTGENVLLQNRRCADGSRAKKLACESRIIVDANTTETSIDENDNLLFVDYDEPVTPDEYCYAKTDKGKGIYLVCFAEDEYHHEYIIMINVVLSFISVIFIILTIAVYLSSSELMDLQGVCLVRVISGLGFSFIILEIMDLSSYIPQQTCQILAYLMYTAFMYAFFWLNILSFHLWKMIVNPKIFKSIKHWTLIYHIFGLGGPLLLVLFVLTANYSGLSFFHHIHPGIGEVKCWFKNPMVTFIYFYAPISVLLGVNVIYFVWTIIVLWSQMKHCSEKKTKVLKYRLLLCIKLFFLMGITWCFEVISAIFESSTPQWVWIIPDAFNALQGLLIFLLLVVFRKKAIRALANKKIFRSIRLPASWRHVQDDECEELEEEMSLSGVEQKKAGIPDL